MAENQNIEYKSSWHDEHLKWVCGFANAAGDTLFLGKNDKSEEIGIYDHKTYLNSFSDSNLFLRAVFANSGKKAIKAVTCQPTRLILSESFQIINPFPSPE